MDQGDLSAIGHGAATHTMLSAVGREREHIEGTGRTRASRTMEARRPNAKPMIVPEHALEVNRGKLVFPCSESLDAACWQAIMLHVWPVPATRRHPLRWECKIQYG